MKATGRGWAYFGAILGGALSVAANVAHSYIAGDPSWLKVVFSVAWPVLLFVGIEVLARVAFPKGAGYALLRFVGVGLVALVAAIVSYRHLSGLFAHYGEDAVTVVLGPVAIDGLLAVCSAAMILTARKRALAAADPAQAPMRETTPATPDEGPEERPQPPAPTEDTPEPVQPAVDPLPTPAPAVVPAMTEAPAEPNTPDILTTAVAIPPAPSGGRPATQTRALAELLKTENPDRTQQHIATMLGMSRWALRDALKATAPRPSSPPKLELVSTDA
ncbi:hypothetical protein [Micromonospora sp. WMMD980]|uniref:hypothetical protein n=1 Tax=Micromonospora sp. WMMD980 TaxID=3016088 RepID=UPI002415ED49|nr:hypothetical protein [Micromonospora sp. WMMD980]MDG4801757.1 hypothetical protein [Micromonospora sp. WMMD980]